MLVLKSNAEERAAAGCESAELRGDVMRLGGKTELAGLLAGVEGPGDGEHYGDHEGEFGVGRLR
jgi:hypothetical protein